jgi:predicted regulator of Ras-like GTPase activity (Roadblock/LC7/MglB family)
MRRASRDLRILAGYADDDLAGPVTSLLDVIRVAASAIERYEQIRVGRVATLAVEGYAADDVGSLLAALLENATDYSPDEVTVSAHLLEDGAAMFRVDDSGIGMSEDQVAELNALLAGPVPELAERAGRHTGFPVVHRLASRHQIKVRLASRPMPRKGVLAMVTLPPHLLCDLPEDANVTQEGTVLRMMEAEPQVPRSPQEFGWLLNNFASSTPGVSHALIVSSDGLPLVAAAGMSPDLADPLAAMTSGILALGNNIAGKVGEPQCEQIMLKFPGGHFLFMTIGSLAGFAVLVKDGANLGVVAHQMAQLVDAVGHVLTPQLREDLRQSMAAGTLAAGG